MLAASLIRAQGIDVLALFFETPFFNEFVLKVPDGFEQKRTTLANDKCTFAGINLETFYPELKQHYLFCATETLSKHDIDQLAKEVQ